MHSNAMQTKRKQTINCHFIPLFGATKGDYIAEAFAITTSGMTA